MDDLNGLQWTSNNAANKPPPTASSIYQAMRATPPTSGRSTPFATGASNPPSKPSTPANDSFANLVAFNSAASSKNLSLQEQQKRLIEERARQQASKAQQANVAFGGASEQFWNNLGSGRSTPLSILPQASNSGAPKNEYSGSAQATKDETEDDILAAFKATAPVDDSTHFPKPGGHLDPAPSNDFSTFDDDDPFGLSEVKLKKSNGQASATGPIDDDDVLGLLGRPVSELPKQREPVKPVSPPETKQASRHPQDKAVAELVDMGFPSGKAREALEATESGLDVQAAVGWLLHQAHEESQQRSKATPTPQQGRPLGYDRKSSRRRGDDDDDDDDDEAQWTRTQSRDASSSRRRGANLSAEKDSSQIAADFGNSLFKTAGSLWKQGTKKMQQAVQEFNTGESDSSTPKWMREASADGRIRSSSARATHGRHNTTQPSSQADFTNEAMMLESSRERLPPRQTQRPVEILRPGLRASSRDHSPALPSRPHTEDASPGFLRQQQAASGQTPFTVKSSLNKQAIEDQAAAAYTSSARRRKPAAPATGNPPTSEPDLLDATASLAAGRPSSTTSTAASAKPYKSPAPIVSRQATPIIQRQIPKVPHNVLAASRNHREAGTSQFKRGDFSASHASYTSSLTQIPTTHPITIVILTNRALTALKIGEPKTALTDANHALTAIGSSKGDGESITISEGEPPKPMREYYGKALMRKAEALEQLEKWADAAAVWREAVNGGHGGSVSMQGRTRCEKAAGISKPAPVAPTSSASSTRQTPVRKPASAPPRPLANSQASDVAVSKLREANAAAERLDDEKFRLTDSVDAKLTAWKGGKADNLRALLGSLDTVLWPEAGWKKIGMSELVLPQKVKIHYMKGIAKVHPDKIPTTATTEQRMIAGAVFSTLNEAWDKFKTENNL